MDPFLCQYKRGLSTFVSFLLQRYLRMLHGQQGVFLGEVEHVEDYVLVTSVLAVVDGVHHFYYGLALMNNLGLAVQSYDGQLALHQYAVIHNGVVVPA